MQNKIVELLKLERGCKKRAKALKIPISITRAMIKWLQSTKDVTNLPGRGRVSIVLMHGEEESLSGQSLSKDHSWRIAEISSILGSESLKKIWCSDKNSPRSSKNKLQQIQLSNWLTGTSIGTGFYGQMKHKKSFLAANPPDGFSTNRDKMYPMHTVKYTAGSLMWACFSDGCPGQLVQKHGIVDSINR